MPVQDFCQIQQVYACGQPLQGFSFNFFKAFTNTNTKFRAHKDSLGTMNIYILILKNGDFNSFLTFYFWQGF
jgi:hypothetical protein